MNQSKFAFPLRNTPRKCETCLGETPKTPFFSFSKVVIMPLTPEQKRAYRQADKERGKKRITLTLTEEEYLFVERKANEVKQRITPYFKNAALHNMAERRHLNQEELEMLREAIIEVRRIGNNLNQLSHNNNSGFTINPDEVRYQMRYLEDTIKKFFGR